MGTFGSVDLKVRPIRLAFLVDPQSARQVKEAIQLSSSIWGGAYCPIIPLHKRMPATWKDGSFKAPKARDVISGYVDAFDPDLLVQLSKNVPSYLQDGGRQIIHGKNIWETLDEKNGPTLCPKFGIGIFEVLTDVFDKNFKYKAKYQSEVLLPQLPKRFNLFWASLFGELPAKLMPIMREHYYEPLEIKDRPFEPNELAALLQSHDLFPKRLTQWALDQTGNSGFRRNVYAFFLDITKTEDIIDFWNLRAMGRRVLPIPKQFQSEEHMRALAVGFFREHRRHWGHNKTVCDFASIVRSRNSTMAELEAYSKTLTIERDPTDPSQDPYFSLQHWYPRVWDEWARDKDGAVPDEIFGEERSVVELPESEEPKASFRSLLPKFAAKHGFTGEPRCANDISFRLYGTREHFAEAFPKSSGQHFLRAISGRLTYGERWRVGKNGLTKLVEHGSVETLVLPQSDKVVFAWLKDLGWESELSTPGLLAKEMYKQLDGHALTLANERLLGLIEYMNGGSVQSDGQPMESNRFNHERELPIGEVKTRLNDSSMRRDLTEYLVSKGVFHVGLKVQCPNCTRRSWYSVETIGRAFTCPRCLNAFPAIGHIENGTWCYKTTGPFSIPNYADGAFATLLAVEFFDDIKMTSLQKTAALSFTARGDGKPTLEADFALFWQQSLYGETTNGLVFGECKTYGKFKAQDVDRLRSIADAFPGAVLTFATLRKSLTPKEVSSIARLAKRGRKYWKNNRPINPVLILTGNELLSFHGPPYCWEGAGHPKKFERVAGLMSVCNATQELYLDLPSWESEWHEAWEKRRQKREARKQLREP